MSATCGNCTAFTVPFTGSLTVRLCPLHAEAEAMREALGRAADALRGFIDFAPRVTSFESEAASMAAGRPIAESQSRWYIGIVEDAAAAEAAARPILARIAGDAA